MMAPWLALVTLLIMSSSTADSLTQYSEPIEPVEPVDPTVQTIVNVVAKSTGLSKLLEPANAKVKPIPPQGVGNPNMPYVVLKNAALPGTKYPMTGLGLNGPGWKIGQKEECWHYPTCCTKDYCPAINATREWLKMGGWRIDTGYPYGDISPGVGPTSGITCYPGMSPTTRPGEEGAPERKLGHSACDPHGTYIAIKESGVKREDMFVTVKSGFAGPMKEIDEGYTPFDIGQADYQLEWLGLDYADLYLMHEGDLGNYGNFPAPLCFYPTSTECRVKVFASCIDWMKKGKVRACGVANWELEWLHELVAANVTLPAVVQMKFHLHQSFNSPRIKAIKDFCDEHGIVFNGYSPLGRADWTVFNDTGMTATTLEEPVVLEIAKRVNRTPAQVILRWNAQQGIPTQPRTMSIEHMKENLDVFDWKLSDDDMQKLGSMSQCNVTRGDPYMSDDPEDAPFLGFLHTYANMIGPTKNC